MKHAKYNLKVPAISLSGLPSFHFRLLLPQSFSMQQIMQQVSALYTATFGTAPVRVEKVPQSGSDRVYFRVTGEPTCIATWSKNIKETQTFLKFSKHFKQANCPVPTIYAVSADEMIYLQEDFGDVSLLNELEQHGYTEHTYRLFQQSLQQLAHMQIKGWQCAHGGKIRY